MYRNLVFEGGGCNGICYCGCIKALREMYDFPETITNASGAGSFASFGGSVTHFAGSSAGSILAASLACGATPEYIETMLRKLDYSSFEDGGWGLGGDAYRLLEKYGVYKGDTLLDFTGGFLEELTGNPDITFQQLYEKKKNVLMITGTNLTLRKTVIFSHAKTPDMPIKLAVRISSSFPLFFEPVQWPDPETGIMSLWVDGGLLNNFPSNLFPSEHTLGFRLDQSILVPPTQPTVISGIKDYLVALGDVVYEQAQKFYTSRSSEKSIVIPVKRSSMDFNVTPQIQTELIKLGYDTTKEFLTQRKL